VRAALLARGGARVDPRAIDGALGFEAVLGARWPSRLRAGATTAAGADAPRAIEHNWIKLYPSCLGTHSPIEAAALARDAGAGFDDGAVEVRVHPVARQAAHLDEVTDGLSAKFSIPYCVAHTVLHNPPGVRDFADVDPEVVERSSLVTVTVDRSLPEFGAVLMIGGSEAARVAYPQGAPERGVEAAALARKVHDLAGERLDGLLDDLGAPAAAALDAAVCGAARVPRSRRGDALLLNLAERSHA
jgi:2-methylcitrate dehydratase PrpD